jgi:transcriptional regulator with XRE-family HTH domain
MADQPDPIDVYVGNSIRALRKRAGVSQQRLADACGITFQQIQKYERAANRVSASTLSRVAQHLNAPIDAFFPAVDEHGAVGGLGPIDKLASASGGCALAGAFLSLPLPARPGLVRIAQAMAEAFAEEPGSAYVTGGDTEAARNVA